MKKTKTYRLNDVTLKQLEMLQEYYQWNHTELIEKAVAVLEQLMVSEKYDIPVGSFSLPDGEKKVFFEVK